MGILSHTSNFQNSLKNTNKIPDYAREYRNEYLFIRGINELILATTLKSYKNVCYKAFKIIIR